MSGFLPFFNSEGGPPIGAASGDLSGNYPGPTVAKISGSSPITISPAILEWTAATLSPTLLQAQSTTGAGQNLTIQSQAARTGHNEAGGNLVLSSGLGDGTGVVGAIQLYTGGANKVAITTTQVQINEPIVLQTVAFSDGYSGATTTDGSVYTIYTDAAMSDSTAYDFILTVMGRDAADGFVYRADFAFTYQRIGGAGPTLVDSNTTPINVRNSVGAATWGGAAIALSGNSVTVTVQGTAGKTIAWSLSFNRLSC